ncbi:UNVERIFIED_CONTAM: hypothetical protein HDU68_002565 [Siphonaria sp. JEL0065]|nr:hypothetical protein HDU68_002565 [Siphonaria sp. JEL0065]
MLPPLVPKPSFLLGNAKQISNNPVPFLRDCSNKYGSLFRITVVGREFYVLDASNKEGFAELVQNESMSLMLGGLNTMRFDCYLRNGAAIHSEGRNAILLRSHFQSTELDALAPKTYRMATQYLRTRIQSTNGLERNVSDLSLSLVAVMSAHGFLGDILSRNEQVVEIFKTFFLHAEWIAALTTLLPSWLVPVVIFFFLPLHTCKQRMRLLLIPEIKRRRRKNDKEQEQDLLQLLVDGEPDNETVVTQVLLLIIAAMRNTSIALNNLFYELAGDEGLMEALRDEIVGVIGEDEDPLLTRVNLGKMVLLDSVIRESLYQNAKPISTVRTAWQDTMLLGFHIPKGSNLLVFGANLHGRSYWDEPEELFEPRRWIGTGKHSTSTSADFVAFGGGKTICPGRLFGMLELKTVLSSCMLNFKMSLRAGYVMPKKEFSMKHVLPRALANGTETPILFTPSNESS